MSEKVWRVKLSELQTVRIQCEAKNERGVTCNAVSELFIDRIDKYWKCPACNQQISNEIHEELKRMRSIVKENWSGLISIEFAISEPITD